jgi:arsenite methyltransferase
MSESIDVREAVRARYASAALRVLRPGEASGPVSCCGGMAASEGGTGASASCCGGSSCGADPISSNLYNAIEVGSLPSDAVLASLGCGNPTVLASLELGETVLDLGSGGGIDVLLSARRVGPTGKAYGLDMTDEMLALARRNAEQAGATNVEFLKGQIEEIPLPDNSVGVVISNCVINLSADKSRVLREAYRVLKPGGRFAVSDVVVDGPVPEDLRRQVELWVGCLAGALDRKDYEAGLSEAGFVDVALAPTRYYDVDEIEDPTLATWLAAQPEAARERLGRAFMSAFVRARKPG